MLNLYTFKSATQHAPFVAWLNENVGKRYRLTRRTFAVLTKRQVKKHVFHSMRQCTEHRFGIAKLITRHRQNMQRGWAHCGQSRACFSRQRTHSKLHHIIARSTSTKRRKLFVSRYGHREHEAFMTGIQKRFGISASGWRKYSTRAISVIFDSAADMILCKMLWHDKQTR